METKHTAGPWHYQAYAGDHDFGVYSETSGRDVALVRDFNEANAALIAAAPAMYRVLSRIAEYATHGQDRVSLSALMHDGDDTIGQAIEAAISAVEGNKVQQ